MHEAMCIHKMEDLQKRHNGINDDFSSHGHDGATASKTCIPRKAKAS